MLDLLAQSSTSPQGSPLGILILVLPLGLLYFLMIRPQQRRARAQQALQRSLEVGDEVVTSGGIFGQIIDIDEDEGVVVVEIAAGTRVRMLRGGVSSRVVDEDEDDEEYEDDDEEADEES